MSFGALTASSARARPASFRTANSSFSRNATNRFIVKSLPATNARSSRWRTGAIRYRGRKAPTSVPKRLDQQLGLRSDRLIDIRHAAIVNRKRIESSSATPGVPHRKGVRAGWRAQPGRGSRPVSLSFPGSLGCFSRAKKAAAVAVSATISGPSCPKKRHVIENLCRTWSGLAVDQVAPGQGLNVRRVFTQPRVVLL